jgi:hypothetical protein
VCFWKTCLLLCTNHVSCFNVKVVDYEGVWAHSSIHLHLEPLFWMARWRWMISFTPRLLYPWGRSTHLVGRRVGGLQRRSGLWWRRTALHLSGLGWLDTARDWFLYWRRQNVTTSSSHCIIWFFFAVWCGKKFSFLSGVEVRKHYMSFLKGISVAGFGGFICGVKIQICYLSYSFDGIRRRWYLVNILPSYTGSGGK